MDRHESFRLIFAFVLEKTLTGMIFEKYTRTQAMAKVIPRFRDKKSSVVHGRYF